MLRLKYKNNNGEEIYFGDLHPVHMENKRFDSDFKFYYYLKDNTQIYFLTAKGFDGVDADPIFRKAPYQKGQTKIGINIDERVISIKACLVTDSVKEEESMRRQILSTLSPFKVGVLELYGDSFAKMFSNVQVIDGPTFEDDKYDEPDGILFFNFTAVVPHNFLEDLEKITFHLVQVEPCFEFILEFADTIMFGNMTNRIVHFVNNGDVEAPLIVEIPGPVKTPKIINLNTGEYIKVNSPIKANETMIINTSFGNKTVVIKNDIGEERNAFHYLDPYSTFFQLAVGDNDIEFDAEVGNDTAKVKMYYKRLYLGV